MSHQRNSRSAAVGQTRLSNSSDNCSIAGKIAEASPPRFVVSFLRNFTFPRFRRFLFPPRVFCRPSRCFVRSRSDVVFINQFGIPRTHRSNTVIWKHSRDSGFVTRETKILNSSQKSLFVSHSPRSVFDRALINLNCRCQRRNVNASHCCSLLVNISLETNRGKIQDFHSHHDTDSSHEGKPRSENESHFVRMFPPEFVAFGFSRGFSNEKKANYEEKNCSHRTGD